MAHTVLPVVDAVPSAVQAPRPSVLVRVTHWITTVCAFVLLFSGIEIVISHPRFYWGETGNVMTPSLFDIPIPASRPWVQTGYGYVLPDQNGWSRDLHFQAAWILLFTALAYVAYGLIKGHFRKNLLPEPGTFNVRTLANDFASHLRFQYPSSSSYNLLQRLTYLAVIFVLFPVAIWTGLAMSPAITSVFPFLVTSLGGHQSARTIHFFVTVFLVAFVIIHVAMVCLAGFTARMRTMTTGGHNS